jgi:hypothetical protein
MSINLSTPERTKGIITPTWSDIIKPASANLLIGNLRTGKTALAFQLLEQFSQEYHLMPIVVGYPRNMKHLIPERFVILDTVEEVKEWTDAIIFMDEGDIQLPLEETKMRKYVVNFLSLPGQRNQILLLAFHFPRLVLSRYLPYFSSIIIKRPPFLLEFASKSKNDVLIGMMQKAEDNFRALKPEDTTKNSYIIAPHMRWEGMLTNPLPSFWTPGLSKAWALGEE